MIGGKYSIHTAYRSTDEEAFSKIPSHWTTKRVRFVLLDGADGIKIGPFGSALKLDGMVNNGVRVYGQENVIKKNFSLGKRRISNKKFEEMSVYKICPNDLLITMMGTSGKCELVPVEAEEGIIDSHLLRLRVKESEISPEFFRLLIDESVEIEHQVKVLGKGSIMHGLNSSIVKNLMLPLPDREEQDHIISFLDHETAKIDTLIDKQQQLIKLLKEKRQAVISHAVTKGLNPGAPMKDSGVEWLGEVPEHWAVSKLYHRTTRIGDGLHSTPKYQDGTSYYFVNGNNLVDGRISVISAKEVPESEYQKHLIELNERTLFLSINGTIGNLAFYQDENIILGKSAAFINCNESLKREFLYYYLQSDQARQYFDQEITGTTIFNLSLNSIRQMKVVLPSIQDQEKVIEFCKSKTNRFDKLISKSERVISLIKERRTALISAAVTGKIDVRNWQLEQPKSSMEATA